MADDAPSSSSSPPPATDTEKETDEVIGSGETTEGGAAAAAEGKGEDEDVEGEAPAAAADVSYPLTVVYCKVCGVPPEYCPYGPDWERCKVWIAENHPELMPSAKGASVARAGASAAAGGAGGVAAGAESSDEEGAGKRKGGRKKKKSAKPDPTKAAVYVMLAERKRRKFVTTLLGMESFDLKLKDVAKKLGKKFATGSSVTTNASGQKQIEILGDATPTLADVLVELFSCPREQMFRKDKDKITRLV